MKKTINNRAKKDKVNPYVFIFLSSIVSIISSLGALLIPEISNFYHISPTLGKWSLTIALISSAVSTPILAKLSDFGNYKNVTLAALIATTFGCALSSFSSNYYMFLIGRALQGISLGIIPCLIIAANKILPDSRKTISSLSVATAVGLGIGYPLSGMLTTFFGIKYIFLFGGIFSLFSAIVALKLINVKEKEVAKKKFDFYGSVIITLILSFLILLFNSLESNSGIQNSLFYFIGFCLLLFLWINIEAKTGNPIISIRVIKLPESLLANAISILSGTVIYILITASMLRIQQSSFPGLAETPLMAGLVLTPMSITTIISCRYITLCNFSNYFKSLVGSVFIFLAIIAFMLVNEGIIFEFLCMALCGYGIGLIFGALPHIIKENLNKSDAAEAFSLNQISRSIGYSMGSVISVNIISSFFLNYAGEPSKNSYMLLAAIGLIITLFLFMLIAFFYKRFDNPVKSFQEPASRRKNINR